MRRLVALAAAGSLLAAVPAEAKPLRFAAKRSVCVAKKKQKRAACRKAARSKAWRAGARRPLPLPAPHPLGQAAAPQPEPEPAPVAHTPQQPGAPAAAEQDDVVAPPPAPLCDPSPWLGVIAEDADGFRLRLTRLCVPAGTVLFQFRNEDLAFHNLWAEGTDPARPSRQVVGDTPGETMVTAGADLPAGQWRLYCSLPGHEAMTRLVDVTPAG